MDHQQHRLTSAELSELWSDYINDSMAVCFFKHMLQTVEDNDIRSVIEYALQLSETHIQKIALIFEAGNYPIPFGFTDQDVDLTAPRLYTDEYMINEVRQISQMGLMRYAQALSFTVRKDVQAFFTESLKESIELREKAMNVLLSKGLYVRAPYITTQDRVDFVTKKSFLTGFLGKKRPLLSVEIASIFDNIQHNMLGKQLITGFYQVARSEEVKQYMKRGKEIAAKHVEVFGTVLREGDVPAPVISDTGVTNSNVPPVSDKLMMFQTVALNAVGLAYYGKSMSTAMRSDLNTDYARLSAEIGKYAESGANILIENGWMEEPPRMIDHKEISEK